MKWYYLLLYIPILWDEELFVQSRLTHPLFIAFISSLIWNYPLYLLFLPSLALTLLFFKRFEMGQSVEIESGFFSTIFFISFIVMSSRIDGIKTNVPFLSFLISLLFSLISLYFKVKIRLFLKGNKYDLYRGFFFHTLRYVIFVYLAYFTAIVVSEITISWNKVYLPFYPFILAFISSSFLDYVKKGTGSKMFYVSFIIGTIILMGFGL